jgi:hypothetical protein
MTQPAVTIQELDGALGVLPPTSGLLYAIVGVADGGPTNTPATFARIPDVVSTFKSGPMVEAATHYIERYGRPVLLTRAAANDNGSVTAAYYTTKGSATTAKPTAAITSGQKTTNDQDLYIRIAKGGALGTAGITYQVSYDGGRTLSPAYALGTALKVTLAEQHAEITLGASAEVVSAGDVIQASTTAPAWNNTGLGAALDALSLTAAQWELLLVTGACDAASVAVIEGKIEALQALGKDHAYICSARLPTLTVDPGDADTDASADLEDEATYLGALNTAFSSTETQLGVICAGATKLTSSVSGRRYRQPFSYGYAAREAASSEEVNTADPNLGPLPGMTVRDANGNPDEHDESIHPGLDDAKFCVARTWDGLAGVYVNRPRLFSNPGSDFQLLPHRRVMNIARAALRLYFIYRLNKPIRCDKRTGFILEAEALEIEAGARAAMRAALLSKPKASAIDFSLSRTDNILASKTLTGDARVLPLAYPEFINVTLGFMNPALQTL